MGLSDQLIDSFFLNGSFEDPLSRAIHHSIGILFSMRLSRVKGNVVARRIACDVETRKEQCSECACSYRS